MTRSATVKIKDGCGTDQLTCVESNGGVAVNIQDDLTTLVKFNIIAEGHIVTNCS